MGLGTPLGRYRILHSAYTEMSDNEMEAQTRRILPVERHVNSKLGRREVQV